MIESSEASIQTARGIKRALVMTPRQHVVVGRERLAALRSSGAQDAIDRQCVIEVERRCGRLQLLVFRGSSDEGDGSWRFADDLAPDEADDVVLFDLELERVLGEILVDQLPLLEQRADAAPAVGAALTAQSPWSASAW